MKGGAFFDAGTCWEGGTRAGCDSELRAFGGAAEARPDCASRLGAGAGASGTTCPEGVLGRPGACMSIGSSALLLFAPLQMHEDAGKCALNTNGVNSRHTT